MRTPFRNPAQDRLLAPFLVMLLAPAALRGQEVSLGLGRLHEVGAQDYTYTWQMQYFRPFTEDWGASLGWLNEGHIPDHHRDGAVLQAWRTHRIRTNNLRLGLGLGAYYFFNTTSSPSPSGYENHHGLKPILSLRAQYPIAEQGWEAFFQINRPMGSNGHQTQAMLLGASFRFGPQTAGAQPLTAPRGEDRKDPRNHLALMLGQTIMNSFESESTSFLGAFSLEYRRRLSQHLDLSIAYSDEGSIDTLKRDGVAIQGWISARSATNEWALAFGIGPYVNRVFPTEEDDAPRQRVTVRTNLRCTMLVDRALWEHWTGRMQWDRTYTSQHADTDVLLAGLVYQW